MHAFQHIPPDKMPPEQRRREVASLLANGLARLRLDEKNQSADIAEENEVLLGFYRHPSVHADTVNNTKTES